MIYFVQIEERNYDTTQNNYQLVFGRDKAIMKQTDKLEALGKMVADLGNWNTKKHISQVKYSKLLAIIRRAIKLQLRIYDTYRELERGILARARRDGYNLEETV